VVRAAGPGEDMESRAKALVAALAKEDFTAAGADFDAAMKKTFPADKLQAVWKGLRGQVGALQKQTGLRKEKKDGFDVVVVTCAFEKATLDVRITFTADRQVTGLFFAPSQSATPYKAPSYVRRDSFREMEVKLGTGEWTLPGTLAVPEGDGPFVAVVLVHGSGAHDRDETIGPNRPFRDLAWGLASRGIAVLRYEKRTKQYGVKMAGLKDLTVKEETIDDALAAGALLRKTAKIDPKRVFLVGHSLGAMVAPQVGELDPGFAGLILLASPTRPLEDLLIEQTTYLLSLGGPLSAEQKAALDKLKTQVARIKEGKVTADTPASELPLGVPGSYWLGLRAIRPAETAAKLKQPLLILQGERDYQVTMTDFDGWKKALGQRKNVELKSYPKLNHLFMEGAGETKAKPAEYEKEGHVAQEVIEDIAAWIKKQ
jgi:dienelactone hydrolase